MDEIKTCPVCGSPVPKSKGTRPRIYCSEACLVRSGINKATEKRLALCAKKLQSLSCKNCGKSIPEGHRLSKRFCSPKCRTKFTYEKHKQKILAGCRAYQKDHPEQRREINKRYAENHREKIKEKNLAYYYENRDQYKERHLVRYYSNIEKSREHGRIMAKKRYEQQRLTLLQIQQKRRDKLPDYLVIDLIRKHDRNIDSKTIPKKLIAIKREQLMIYRSVKQLIQTIKEKQND